MSVVDVWKQGEPMSANTAVEVLSHIKQFHRRLYYFPDKKAFNGDEDFKSLAEAIDGVIGYINAVSFERSRKRKGVIKEYGLPILVSVLTAIAFHVVLFIAIGR